MTTPSILPTPREMVEYLDRYVHGQARAKHDLSVAVYNHYMSQAHRDLEGEDLGRHHILLIGPTGVGKTFMVKLLAKFLGVPVGFSSATGLVETGYKGNSVETLVADLLSKAEGNPRQAEKGIVFVDEIDKIRAAQESGFRDVSGEGVQNALLTLLDGRTSKGQEGHGHPEVDSARLLFICTGAFVGLDGLVRTRLGEGRGRIGFRLRDKEAEDVQELPDQPVYEALCQAQTKDLVQFGMIPEFIGRFATVTVLHELTQRALRLILNDSMERSALKLQQRFALIHGIELVLTDDALDAIAEEAAALGTGARGLHRLIGESVDRVDGRWFELAEEGVCRVTVDRECVEGTAEPKLEKGVPVEERKDEELRKESLRGLPSSPSATSAPITNQSSAPITDTRGWSDEQVRNKLEKIKKEDLSWKSTTGSAHKWWLKFESENKKRLPLVLRLAEELRNRKASITEFFLAYVYSNTDNIMANLHYLDYTRLKKKEEEQKRKDRAKRAREDQDKKKDEDDGDSDDTSDEDPDETDGDEGGAAD